MGKKMDANLRSDFSAIRLSCTHLLASKYPGLKNHLGGGVSNDSLTVHGS